MASQEALQKQQNLQTQYQNYKQTLTSLASRIGDIESEIEEHRLVIATLKPLPTSRTAFRLINGVLVQRTVAEVMPALETNLSGLKEVLDKLVSDYKSKEKEMEAWKTREGVKVVQGA